MHSLRFTLLLPIRINGLCLDYTVYFGEDDVQINGQTRKQSIKQFYTCNSSKNGPVDKTALAGNIGTSHWVLPLVAVGVSLVVLGVPILIELACVGPIERSQYFV